MFSFERWISLKDFKYKPQIIWLKILSDFVSLKLVEETAIYLKSKDLVNNQSLDWVDRELQLNKRMRSMQKLFESRLSKKPIHGKDRGL